MPVAGAAGAAQIPAAESVRALRPGDAVGINIVSGDFNMGATGTVTEVIGNRVYAFGHPFFNLGPIAFPMTRAYVHTLLPSMTSSMKIATTGEVIGTVHQDRATTIAGLMGAAPPTIPVKISLESERGFKKAVRVQGRQRSAVDAAVHLRVDPEHAHVLRARDGRRHVQHQGHDEREVARRHQDRGSVFGQRRVAQRRGLGDGAAHVSARQRFRADPDRGGGPHDSVHGTAAHRDDRAGLARWCSGAPRQGCTAESADAKLSRRGDCPHGAARDSCERLRFAVGDGLRRFAPGSVGTARGAAADRAAQRAAADANAQHAPQEQPSLRAAARVWMPAPWSAASRCPRCRPP